MYTQKDFFDSITDAEAAAIVDYAIKSIGPTDEKAKRLLDYDFKLSNGVMLPPEGQETNTVYAVDFTADGPGRKIINMLADDELEVTDEMRTAFEGFLKNIVNKLNERKEDLALAIGKGVSGKDIPVRDVTVKDAIVLDLPKHDFVLNIEKLTVKGYAAPSVTEKLLAEYERTGEDFMTIVRRKQKAGDMDFYFVTGIKKSKAYYEFEFKMLVDFSIN